MFHRLRYTLDIVMYHTAIVFRKIIIFLTLVIILMIKLFLFTDLSHDHYFHDFLT